MSGRATRSKNPVLESGLKFSERSRSTDDRPDVNELYNRLDKIYFNGEVKLAGFSVNWGANMRSTAGITDLHKRTVSISWEAYQLLPESDRNGIVLHEMIHVKLFRHRMDKDSKHHTGMFISEMDRINEMGPYKVKAHHEIPEDVKEQLHPYVWRCRSCNYILRLPNTGAPGPQNRHLTDGQIVCDNPSWKKLWISY
ncbi:DNA-dependent metalloprotease dvc-1-like [Leptopilina heterotoma]|uniref:DNA-dependent metalloprotease dvc-1-like n=1 Tax=Leptopilina heterotoma TaxID=63436 RepID=UPI001CA898E7|nr:DNA-dependent metalloprotease dvc-1-like [Leptopilina heterotoma]